jgi:hypothetical protein
MKRQEKPKKCIDKQTDRQDTYAGEDPEELGL